MRNGFLRLAGTTGGAVAIALAVFLAVFIVEGGEMEKTAAILIVGLMSLVVMVRPEFGLHLLVMNSVAMYSVFFDIPRVGPLSIVMALQGVVLIAVLVHMSVLRRRVYINVAPAWFIFGYTTLVVLSIVVAEHSGTDNYQLFRQNYLVGFVAFLLILQLIDAPAKLRRMIGLLVLVDLMLVVSGILNKMGLLEGRGMDPERIQGRTVGLLGNPNSLAFTLIGLFPLVLVLLTQSKRLWQRGLLTLLAVANLFVILNTLSRGGFLALGASMLCMLMRFSNDRRLVALLLILMVIVWLLLPAALFNRFQEVQSLRGNDRYTLTMIGLNMAAHNPILGVGHGNFERYFPRYDTHHRGGATAPHNMYTSIAAQTGFACLVLYLIVIGLTWRRLSRLFVQSRARGERFVMLVSVALQAGLTSLLVFGTTSHVEHEYLVFVILGLTLVMERLYVLPAPVPATVPIVTSEAGLRA